MSKEISVTYLRDQAQSYRTEGQTQIARDLVQAANTITALRTERDGLKREQVTERAAVDAYAKENRNLKRKVNAAGTRAGIAEWARDNRDEVIHALRDELEQVNYKLGAASRARKVVDRNAQNSLILLEQAEHERDDNARRLAYVRQIIADQCQFAGIK